MDTLTITIYILIACITASFFAGVITRNYSHVDRLWSILPAVYVIMWMQDYADNLRFVIASVLVIIWAIRLTGNFAIKGGYNFSFKKGFYEEDYRWQVLRQKIPNRFAFEIFNLFFISFYQLTVVFLITLPLYYYGKHTGPITTTEIVLFCIYGLLLLCESVADYQQLVYYKKRGLNEYSNDPRIKLGFNTYGFWKYSRHPNYMCEMGQWVVVYFYLHAVMGYHYSGIGAILLILIFVGSTIMAERITASKYPAYKDWLKATPPWVPFIDMPFRIKHRKAFREKNNLSDF
jgi:steroid 5-alpha reductase family enzyme